MVTIVGCWVWWLFMPAPELGCCRIICCPLIPSLMVCWSMTRFDKVAVPTTWRLTYHYRFIIWRAYIYHWKIYFFKCKKYQWLMNLPADIWDWFFALRRLPVGCWTAVVVLVVFNELWFANKPAVELQRKSVISFYYIFFQIHNLVDSLCRGCSNTTLYYSQPRMIRPLIRSS